jgi:uncharacterized protein (TIGR03435 family)
MPTLSGGLRGQLKAGAVSMALFTNWLSGRDDIGGRVVIDETGLTGSYDFSLNWTTDEQRNAVTNGPCTNPGTASGGVEDAPAGSILTALQEQLGLKLESKRANVEALVIDHIERPSDD